MKSYILRDAIDDYDYLFIANANNYPALGTSNSVIFSPFPPFVCFSTCTKKVDRMVSSVAPTLASWLNHDPDALQKLRNDLGLHLEGTLACVPILTSPICRPGTMIRKSYFINFQADPDPYPAGTLEAQFSGADGVSVSWTSIRFGSGAWQPLARFGSMPGQDPVKGFVYQQEPPSPGRFLSGYRGCTATTGLKSTCTYLYDDFGRTNLFNWGLENGDYSVTGLLCLVVFLFCFVFESCTVTFSYPGRAPGSDVNSIYVEGVRFFDSVPTTTGVQSITQIVSVTDCLLTLEFGVFNM